MRCNKTRYINSAPTGIMTATRTGQTLNVVVDRFLTIGENMVGDIDNLKKDMLQSCEAARRAGWQLEDYCEREDLIYQRHLIIKYSKILLKSVTRVIIIVDIVVINNVLCSPGPSYKEESELGGKVECVISFVEFIKAFSQLSSEIIDLVNLTYHKYETNNEERKVTQMAVANQFLERSYTLLITSSKACLRHPDSLKSFENRDVVFCQMRRAMDMLYFVVKSYVYEIDFVDDMGMTSTVGSAMKQFESLVEIAQIAQVSQQTKETLTTALDSVIEKTEDFTDSAYTSHEQRENILLLRDKVKNHLYQLNLNTRDESNVYYSPHQIQNDIGNCVSAINELQAQLITTTEEQTADLNRTISRGLRLVATLSHYITTSDAIKTHALTQILNQHVEHIVEVCKMLRHITCSEKLQISMKYTELNVGVYGPLVVAAAKTLTQHPVSKTLKENLEAFCDMWQSLMFDILNYSAAIMGASRLVNNPCFPAPVVPGQQQVQPQDQTQPQDTTIANQQTKPVDPSQPAPTTDGTVVPATEKIEGGAEIPNGMNENNDLVKRVRQMSRMAFNMYQFTKGIGTLKTTQDLFTEAEYFAEESNQLYKVVRQFSYQVPVGQHKKELLEYLDKIPTHVQQLQFTVKNPTVGKAATFTKVDVVINEIKNLMGVISKVVNLCFACANKYSLDLAGVGWGGPGSGMGKDDSGSRAGSDQSKLGSSSSTDPSI